MNKKSSFFWGGWLLSIYLFMGTSVCLGKGEDPETFVTTTAAGANGSIAVVPMGESHTFTDVQATHTLNASLAENSKPIIYADVPSDLPNDDDVVEVKNVSVAQRPGTKLVDISYDVFSGATDAVSVSLFVEDDTNLVSAVSVTGDAGSDIQTGTGKSLCWDMGEDWDGQVSDLTFRVIAFESAGMAGMVEIPAGVNAGTNILVAGESYDLYSGANFPATYSLQLDVPLFMDETSVTKTQWDTVYNWAQSNEYSFGFAGVAKGDDHPMTEVSWYDALKWCNARSAMEGKTPCYTVNGIPYRTGKLVPSCNTEANGYRLPFSDEWEYAARGGLVSTRFPNGNALSQTDANIIVNGFYHPAYSGGEKPYTSPVKAFPANGYGLYDMAGNVKNWCFEQRNTYRVVRNSYWGGGTYSALCGLENSAYPSNGSDSIGLRTVWRKADRIESIPGVVHAVVDSRNYTLTVSSRANGMLNSVSRRGYYHLGKSSGGVKPYPNQNTRAYKHSDDKENTFSSYTSVYVGDDYKIQNPSDNPATVVENMIAAYSMAPGASAGYGSIQVDPQAGIMRASATAKNLGGPAQWIDSYGDSHAFSTYQTWGVGESEGGMHRFYEVTGSAPFNMTIDLNYSGKLESGSGSSAGYSSMTLVTLVKDKEAYFAAFENDQWMTAAMASDLWTEGNELGYDFLFGSEDQQVAELLAKESYSGGYGSDEAFEGAIVGDRHFNIWVQPGDLIMVDDLIAASAVTWNPVELLDVGRRARSYGFTVTSDVGVEAGSGGGFIDYPFGEAETVGSSMPAVGVSSNYCWGSVVTCSVGAVEGHINSGWTGTGSVPAIGTATNTGAITLSELNSSITWNWDFDGYALTVAGGSGSGTYANGEVAVVAADPDGFFYWSGDYAHDLEDPFAAVTSLRMPDKSTVLTPVYYSEEVYVDASMPDDSQSGQSWAAAKKTIQAAASLVASDGVVWVTNGVYDVGGAIASGCTISNRLCITRPIAVRSVNGAEVTSIVANSMRAVYMTNGCVLSGFTITGGVADEADGGGVYLADGKLDNCILRENEAGRYGGGLYLAGGSVNNCLIAANDASDGGGVYLLQNGELNNCTVVANGASSGAGGVSLNGGGVVNNCIVWANGASGLYSYNGTVRNTCSSDGVASGEGGCLIADPQFVDAANSDFRLQSSSPCIDLGDNMYAPVADGLGGQSRVINGTVDMGAYERFVVEEDSDIDGVPDWWELRHFGGVTNAPAFQLSANGIDTVHQAFIAGLDPQNPESKFVAQSVRALNGKPLIKWPVTRGRVYSVYWSPDLETNFTLRKANIPWTQEGFEDEESESAETGFYKIKVQLED